MDLKPGKWKLNFRGGKDKWLVALAVGLVFLILAFPAGGKGAGSGGGWMQGQPVEGQDGQSLETNGKDAEGDGADEKDSDSQESSAKPAASKGTLTYEQQLEERLKELLGHVEGVGQVEVMIVLKSSEEKIWRVDRNTSYSSTQETDANGGTRDIRSQETTEGTILSGQSGAEGPLLEKEMRPEISGVVVTADGGGSPTVQAEISAAVEALFDVPSHKIKVLKRAE